MFSVKDPKILPKLSTIKLTCNCLRTAGKAVAGILPINIAMMSLTEVVACLETLGSVVFREGMASQIWAEIRAKAFPDDGVLSGADMVLLNNLLPAVARDNPEMINVDRMGPMVMEGLSVLGRRLGQHAEDNYVGVARNVVSRYIMANLMDEMNETRGLEVVEAESLGHLLCGLTSQQWEHLVADSVFSRITHVFRFLDCASHPSTNSVLQSKVLSVSAPPEQWLPSDVAGLGWLVGTLDPDNLAKIRPDVMTGVTAAAVRQWTSKHWQKMNEKQIAGLGPHAASLIQQSSLPEYLPKAKRRAIRSAVSEDDDLAKAIDELDSAMDVVDRVKEKDLATKSGDTTSDDPTGGSEKMTPASPAFALATMAILVMVY